LVKTIENLNPQTQKPLIVLQKRRQLQGDLRNDTHVTVSAISRPDGITVVTICRLLSLSSISLQLTAAAWRSRNFANT